ncbi:hypothetical protein, partial [Salmonella sp. gx-f5]|uniref:hypothetical protein n=1 Tax=Salmonella sp. gx-f5 TaxID=2582605 RepID=UPI001F214012
NNCCKTVLELAERRNDRVLNERLRIEESKFKAMEKKYKGVLKVLMLSWLFFIVVCGVIVMYPKNYNGSQSVLRLM